MSDSMHTAANTDAPAHCAGNVENWDLSPADLSERLGSAGNLACQADSGETADADRVCQNVDECAPEHWSERCY